MNEVTSDSEWIEKRVADLVPGDEVSVYGEVRSTRASTYTKDEIIVEVGLLTRYMGKSWRVDVRKPDEVTVKSRNDGYWHMVLIGRTEVADFRDPDAAESEAERLRRSSALRRKALGEVDE